MNEATQTGTRARWRAARKRWRHSLKWRLLTVFFLLAVATTAVFVLGVQSVLQTGWQSWAKPLVADYVDKLAADIGSPPDVARAQGLTERLPITVRISGPAVQFDSRDNAIHASQTLSAARERQQLRTRQRWFDGDSEHQSGAQSWGLVRTTADGHRITFGFAGALPSELPRYMGWLTLAALLLLTMLAYARVRQLLRPLEHIGAGVARFGQGQFDQPITARRNDELGDLATRINAMATSLHGMLDAKRALLLAISHELRSPLTRARVNAELVPPSEAQSALLRDLGAMRDLITDLLESERLASGHAALQTSSVNMPALVHELLQTQFPTAAIHLTLDEALPAMRLDALRVRLLLRNLIDNALRHSAGAGVPPVLTIEVRALAQGATELNITVRDHGPGVSDEQLAHLAQPFYRADSARQRSTGGVGLGLTLCRLVAQAHGGRLTFKQVQPGLEVTANWPIKREPPQAQSITTPTFEVTTATTPARKSPSSAR